MKKRLLLITALMQIFIINFLFAQNITNTPDNPENSNGVVLSFITHNAYGNNLYVDNVSVGKQYNNDIFVVSVDNIQADTSYSTSTAAFAITPKVTVVNVGRLPVSTPFNITMTITPGGYSSTKEVTALASGTAQQIVFDSYTLTPGNSFTINVVSNYSLDENPLNNQLSQFSVVLPGVQRNILLEQWTSSTCGPCASNNPTIDAFVENKWSSIVAIKYHVGWPSPGNDPMYLHNPTQSYDRRYYYGVNGVPHVIMDGIVHPDYPYSNAPSLPTAYDSRFPAGSPVSMTVTDQRIAGDSIRAVVNMVVHAPLKFGDYKLRVMAVERKITYANPPGTNNEKIFFDVFRRSYPNSEGTTLNLVPGNYQFTFTYKIDKIVWVDSMIYTAVFIQDDLTKEVVNCAKGRNHTGKNIFSPPAVAVNNKLRSFADDITEGKYSEVKSPGGESLAGFNIEFFEAGFPPAGWRLVNPDGGVTFELFEGANGPGFGGNNSMKLDFYSYSTTGKKDTIITRPFYNIEKSDTVKFDWAYTQYQNENDSLIVRLSIDGGITFPYEIFRKGGATLKTAPAQTSAFVPTANQWQQFAYSLSGTNVPVELTSFSAAVVDGSVNLAWTTATELNNFGFEIERSLNGSNFYKIGFVNGNGTTSEKNEYSFKDNFTYDKEVKVYYRLRQVDFDGSFEYSNTVNVLYVVPAEFSLKQNYPNPFNPVTTIKYSVAETVPVTLKIYDLTGQEVTVLVNEVKEAGSYEIKFDASSFTSGIYFYKLTAGNFSSIKKMAVLK